MVVVEVLICFLAVVGLVCMVRGWIADFAVHPIGVALHIDRDATPGQVRLLLRTARRRCGRHRGKTPVTAVVHGGTDERILAFLRAEDVLIVYC